MQKVKVINTRTATPVIQELNLPLATYEDLKYFLSEMDEFRDFDFSNATVVVRNDENMEEQKGLVLDTDSIFDSSKITVFISPKKVSQGRNAFRVYPPSKLKEIRTYLLNITAFLEDMMETAGIEIEEEVVLNEAEGNLTAADKEMIARLQG